jgi:hypothetical protein
MKFALICALIAAPLACADETTKSAKVEELLVAMNVEQQQKEMMDQMSQMVIQQVKSEMAKEGNISPAEIAKMEDRQTKLFALIKDETSWTKMKPIFLKSYSETFTEPEIDAMLAFYHTPAGKAMVEKQPSLSTKIMTGVQSQMSNLIPRIEEILKQ